MELEEFYRVLLPPEGVFCLFNKRTKHHVWFESLEALIDESEATVGTEPDWFFATASFSTPGSKFEGRKQSNVKGKKCIYLDLDAGEEKFAKSPEGVYPTQKDALTALREFIISTGISPTYIVSSGAGLHVYYALEEELDPETWERFARAFKVLGEKYNLKIDNACTTDSARVLRPIGAIHHSGATVQTFNKNTGEIYNHLDLWKKLNTLGAVQREVETSISDDVLSNVSGVYSPKSAEKIAAHCAVMGEMRDSGGNIPEPAWRAMLGVMKHCVDGEELVHEWSSGYKGYNYKETQEKFDKWDTPPATCDYIAGTCSQCDGCRHRGMINSPIKLGGMTMSEQAEKCVIDPPIKLESESADTGERLPSTFPEAKFFAGKFSIEWERGYPVLYGFKKVRAEDENTGELVMKTLKLPIVKSNVFYFKSWSSADAAADVTVTYLMVYRNSRNDWREVAFDSVLTADRSALLKFLAGLGVNIGSPDATTINLLLDYVLMTIQNIKLENDDLPVAKESFGFQFIRGVDPVCIHGNYAVRRDGSLVRALIGKGPSTRSDSFRVPCLTKYGQLDKYPESAWDDLVETGKRYAKGINMIYPHAEQGLYRFALMSGLCSPYMCFVAQENPDETAGKFPAWGFVVSLYSTASGRGKTTLMKACAAGLAHHQDMTVSGGQTGISEVTVATMAKTMGTYPLFMDETTSSTPEFITKIVYSLSNGQNKVRTRQSGEISGVKGQWTAASLWSSNVSMRDVLNINRASSDATQMRIIELDFDGYELKELMGDWSEFQMTLNREVFANRGALGLLMARYALTNWTDMIYRGPLYVREAAERFGLTAPERFYGGLYAAIRLTLDAYEHFGIKIVSRDEMEKEFYNAVLHSREFVNSEIQSGGDLFREAVRSMSASIAVTETMTKTVTGATDILLNEHTLRTPMVGRYVKTGGALYIASSAMRKWCSETGNNLRSVLAGARQEGFMLNSGEQVRIRLTRGLPKLPPMQTWAYVFNVRDAMYDDLDESRSDNVVDMPVVSDDTSKFLDTLEEVNGTE